MESSSPAAGMPAGMRRRAAWGCVRHGLRSESKVAQETPTQGRAPVEPVEESGTDGRKAATQARILGAARALFTERGYERTTIAAIASEAKLIPAESALSPPISTTANIMGNANANTAR